MWARVVASVRPLAPRAAPADVAETPPARPAAPAPRPKPGKPSPPPRAAGPGITLDSSWDRRLARGLVQPDA
ncbi:MAG TPA: DNA mismatch repair protein MutS, partial [Allosphingosinicella sp.]|nr:DNA mismatch repair protein MutS [Allosphingosinicella sp.]